MKLGIKIYTKGIAVADKKVLSRESMNSREYLGKVLTIALRASYWMGGAQRSADHLLFLET